MILSSASLLRCFCKTKLKQIRTVLLSYLKMLTICERAYNFEHCLQVSKVTYYNSRQGILQVLFWEVIFSVFSCQESKAWPAQRRFWEQSYNVIFQNEILIRIISAALHLTWYVLVQITTILKCFSMMRYNNCLRSCNFIISRILMYLRFRMGQVQIAVTSFRYLTPTGHLEWLLSGMIT